MNLESINRIEQLLQEAERIAKDDLGINNLFYNESFVELFMAAKLDHEYNNNTQGGDAIEPLISKPTEYKAINSRSKSKGSFQFHWLSENKIKKYQNTENMYFAVRDGVTITDIYKVPTSQIMPLLESKSTNSKSINGHAGFNVDKLIETFNAEKVY